MLPLQYSNPLVPATDLLICGWGFDALMWALLKALDHGTQPLPLGARVTLLNTHSCPLGVGGWAAGVGGHPLVGGWAVEVWVWMHGWAVNVWRCGWRAGGWVDKWVGRLTEHGGSRGFCTEGGLQKKCWRRRTRSHANMYESSNAGAAHCPAGENSKQAAQLRSLGAPWRLLLTGEGRHALPAWPCLVLFPVPRSVAQWAGLGQCVERRGSAGQTL